MIRILQEKINNPWNVKNIGFVLILYSFIFLSNKIEETRIAVHYKLQNSRLPDLCSILEIKIIIVNNKKKIYAFSRRGVDFVSLLLKIRLLEWKILVVLNSGMVKHDSGNRFKEYCSSEQLNGIRRFTNNYCHKSINL